MHVPGRHDGEMGGIGDASERAGEGVIPAHRVALELHEEAFPAEHRATPVGEPAGGGRPFPSKYRGYQAGATPGEDE